MPEITEYQRDENGVIIIPDGAEHWSELVRENFDTISALLGEAVDAANSEEVQRLERNLRALIEELRVGVGYELEDKVDRDEFEHSQQKQDQNILALQQSMDTGFTGQSVVHTFAPTEIQHWKGWDGGLVEGSVNSLNQLTN